MKSMRLVFGVILMFFSTAVCGLFDSGPDIGGCDQYIDPDRQQLCFDQQTQTAVEKDRILSLTLTQSVLNITYPAAPVEQTETALVEMQATDAALTAAAALTLSAAPPAQITEPQVVLQSGTYEVDVSTGGRQHHSTWTLDVLNGVITGNSGWDCCPGPRVDPLSGAVVGEEVNIVRDCSGQGFEGPCTQTYSGKVKGNVISGTITGTGIPPEGATWTLYLSP